MHVSGKNVAYIVVNNVSTEGDGPWISGLWVHPNWRRLGIAKTLMEEVERDYEGKTIRLRAKPYKDREVDTETLVHMYEKWGFELYDDQHRMKKG